MKRVLTVGAAVALAATTAFAAAPAEAATAARNHVVALTGSNGYVVYEVAKSTKDIVPGDRNKGTVYARDKKGTVSTLKNFVTGVGVIQQTGHSVIERTFANRTEGGVTYGIERVRYHDLKTGAESVVDLGQSESLATVAPDGYVVRHDAGNGDGGSVAGDTTLTYRHFDGSTAGIAVPFAGGLDYALGASDTGLVAVSPGSDEQTRPSRIAYMTWADPGVWHAIYNAGQPRDISCAAPTTTHVACRVDGIDSASLGPVLFRLKDGHATWLYKKDPKACPFVSLTTKGTNLYAVETSNAGVCTKGKLYRMQDDGTLVEGTGKYLFNALGGITTAYNRVVLSGGDQRHLYVATGVTRKPVIITKA